MRLPPAVRFPALGPVLGGAALLAGSLALGAAVPLAAERASADPALILVPLGGLAVVAVMAAGPVACIAAIVALTTAGTKVSLGQVGGADPTAADIFFLALVAWWGVAALARMGTSPRARRVARRAEVPPFGRTAAIAFVTFAGLTLLNVAASEPGQLGESFVSWLRLAQTASLAWLAASVIRTEKALKLVLGAMLLGGLVAIGSAVVEVAASGNFGSRWGGLLGPNVIGLLSGLFVVTAAFAPGRRDGWLGHRYLLLGIGITGLLLGKSVGAFVATGLALAIGYGFRNRASSVQRLGALIVSIAVAVFMVFGVVQLVRPSAAPGSEEFRTSSASHRVINGSAAIEVFERHAVFGAGWRRGESPTLTGSPEINAELRARFQGARPDFFPDENPTSAHNTYLQVLADTGLVGFGLFAMMLVGIAIAVRRLLGRLERGGPLWRLTWTIAMALLLVLVWLNDNPLYGGQPETVLAAVLVGALVAISRMSARRAGP
jgi:O-antigen ligase